MRNLFASIGCLVVVAGGGWLAWQHRGQLAATYRTLTGRETGDPAAPTVAPSTGTPSLRALQSAEQKELAIGRRDGPAYVRLTAEEMASLIEYRLDPAARRALDSILVTLGDDRFVLEAQVRAELFGSELLGPLAGMVGPRQPLRLAGPARLRDVEVLAWEVDEVTIHAFPVPGSVIPRLVDRLTGGRNGAFLLRIPSTVGDVRIRPDGVTFYRRAE